MTKSVKISGPSCSKSVCVGKEMREFEGASILDLEILPLTILP